MNGEQGKEGWKGKISKVEICKYGTGKMQCQNDIKEVEQIIN